MAEFTANEGWEDIPQNTPTPEQDFSAESGWEDIGVDDGWEDVNTPELKKSTQLSPEAMQTMMKQSRREGVQLKNFESPERTTPYDKKIDTLVYGDSPQVTEYNQLLNNMGEATKEKYYKDTAGKPFTEKVEIARKYRDEDKDNIFEELKQKWDIGKESTDVDIKASYIKTIKDPIERE